jgi:hypothetical protein
MKFDDKFVERFLTGQVDASEFPHEKHVRVAWTLSRRYPPEEAFEQLVEGIQGIARRAGKPEAYHETITRAWFELISSAESLEQWPELFDKSLINRYYSGERLAAGRDDWLEPDLHSLWLPPPELVSPPPVSFSLTPVSRDPHS